MSSSSVGFEICFSCAYCYPAPNKGDAVTACYCLFLIWNSWERLVMCRSVCLVLVHDMHWIRIYMLGHSVCVYWEQNSVCVKKCYLLFWNNSIAICVSLETWLTSQIKRMPLEKLFALPKEWSEFTYKNIQILVWYCAFMWTSNFEKYAEASRGRKRGSNYVIATCCSKRTHEL